ncbi:MAG: SCP2 sterol-binding domain-containing protein, partial [Myxococcales bacterium]|nr:SCP2 sterol-binding domain-containing protein [Myxococcales bacterium]
DPSSYGSGDVFIGIADHVERHKELRDIATVFQFKLTDPDSVWTIDLKQGQVAEGETAKSECTLELSDADFMAMVRGEADPQQLYFGGKLKISGNIMASQKLTFLQQIDPEAAKKAVIKARGAAGAGGGGGGGGAAAAKAKSAPKKESAPRVSQASELSEEAKKRTAKLGEEDSGFVQFMLQNPEGAFALEIGAGSGKPAGMQTVKASASVSIDEDDFKALLTGELAAQQAFQRGKVRVDGDLTLARAVLEALCQN